MHGFSEMDRPRLALIRMFPIFVPAATNRGSRFVGVRARQDPRSGIPQLKVDMEAVVLRALRLG